MPVSIQSYRCCPIVIDQCHTQCNHSSAWSEQWIRTASEVCLCLLTTWEPPCTVSLAHWCASWMRGASPTTVWGTLMTPPLAAVCFQFSQSGAFEHGMGAVKCANLHLWAANLKPSLVAHSGMALTACCKYLSMVPREHPQKQNARSPTKSALKTSLAIQEGRPLIFSPDFDSDLPVHEIF